MATRTSRSGPGTSLNRVRVFGLLLLAAGVVGTLAWVGMAWYGADHGTVAAGSVAATVELPREADAPGDQDRLSGRDHGGRVVWEGTRAEFDEVLADGRSQYQAELRHDWLLPSLAIAAAGLVVLAWDRSHHPGV
jgi:hypothetical protein